MSQKKNQISIPGLQKCLELLRAGQVDAFERAASELTARYPGASKPIQLVGVAALMRGKLQEAVDALQAAARLDPNDASIWDNLGVALHRAGHNREAIECLQGSVRLDPNVAGVWVNAAAVFGEIGDHVLARNTAARAVKLAPNLVEAHLNLGNALRLLDDLEPALKALLRAVELDPNCAPAHMGLARALHARKALDLALKHARRALEIDPGYADGKLTYALLCNASADAVDVLRIMCAQRPNDLGLAQGLLWSSLMDHRQSPEELFQAHVAFGRRFEPLFAPWRKPHDNDKAPDRVLRIGFLSGDLRRHPVADHLLPLWASLDRDSVQVCAYYTHRFDATDAATVALKALADTWIDAHDLGDDALAERIREDRIDILVDLAGYTDQNRTAVLLRKPAPVQMHWIGYPNSTGLTVIDYYIADALLAPAPKMDAHCTEKLLRLPTYNNQQGMAGAPDVVALPALAKGYVTFGSTARSDKINPAVIALWARVLQSVPGARMLIADAGLEDVRERIERGFAESGVDAARLDFRPRGTEEGFLALHNEIDLILDTFPFNGGTTVTHGLHMGVPTVTLVGARMAQRMALARLAPLGLQDWVAEDEDQFVSIARAKADDLSALATLRGELRQRLVDAPLRQSEPFATAFAAGLRMAWQRWCAGKPPAPIDVPLPKVRKRRTTTLKRSKPEAADVAAGPQVQTRSNVNP